jgi:aryl-alcohol dehydrogenase-like predicted oxidoreductase
MLYRDFGKAGFKVSVLGYGAGMLGVKNISDRESGQILNTLVDLGVTLIDTARGYGLSEERIGRHLQQRRQEIILSTKVGYGIPGKIDWTYECIQAGIEEALRTLRTDYIDIVHLHSCSQQVLEDGGPLHALEEARVSGKVRVAAYSGENEALEWAVGSGRFGSVEHSVNICDQRVIDGTLALASSRGLGVIAKRPLANAPWTFSECPKGEYAEEYWWRWKTMNLDTCGLEWPELALRFSAFTPGVSSCVAGTTKASHILDNIQYIENGPLDEDQTSAITAAFHKNDPGWWTGQI